MTLVVSLKMDQNRVILMPSTAFCLLPPSSHCGKFSHTVKVSQISNKSLMERILCIRHCVRCLTYTFINSLNTTINQQIPLAEGKACSNLFKSIQNIHDLLSRYKVLSIVMGSGDASAHTAGSCKNSCGRGACILAGRDRQSIVNQMVYFVRWWEVWKSKK